MKLKLLAATSCLLAMQAHATVKCAAVANPSSEDDFEKAEYVEVKGRFSNAEPYTENFTNLGLSPDGRYEYIVSEFANKPGRVRIYMGESGKETNRLFYMAEGAVPLHFSDMKNNVTVLCY